MQCQSASHGISQVEEPTEQKETETEETKEKENEEDMKDASSGGAIMGPENWELSNLGFLGSTTK